MSHTFSRREFAALAGGAAGLACLPAIGCRSTSHVTARARTTILFQGDSITDCGRDRSTTSANAGGALGTGYPLLIAAAALEAEPERDLAFFNRGVSGNTVPDLQARWDEDAIALKPDVLSVLIGVNDYWHTRSGEYAGTAADYEAQYTALLERTRGALPHVRLVVLEPFVLRCGEVDATWFPAFDERRAVAARVAKRAGATFVALQAVFDELASKNSPAHWLEDGVHPTPAGHAAIAEHWRAAVAHFGLT